MRAKCRTSRCCSATARRRYVRISRSMRAPLARDGVIDGRRRSARALHQGRREGAAEDSLEDGNLDAAELLRRADVGGGRARRATDRALLHRARRRGSAASASMRSPPTCSRRHAPRSRRSRRPQLLDDAGEYHYRADGRAPQLESAHDRDASARDARGGREDLPRVQRAGQRPAGRRRHAACDCSTSSRRETPCRSTTSNRRRRSSSASRPARCRSARSAARRTRRSPRR